MILQVAESALKAFSKTWTGRRGRNRTCLRAKADYLRNSASTIG
jgi:hypothetical protein